MHARQVAVPDDLHPGVPGMERQHVPFQGFELLRGARVRRGECLVVLTTASIHDMPRHAVISGGSVRDLPIINPRILIVGNKSLDRHYRPNEKGRYSLLAATPCLAVGEPCATPGFRRLLPRVLGAWQYNE